MTYNFDPDRWYDNEKAFLDRQYGSGEISKAAYRSALKSLEHRMEEMWVRLDGSYQLPENERI